jgi:hypothetical protein
MSVSVSVSVCRNEISRRIVGRRHFPGAEGGTDAKEAQDEGSTC